MFEEEPNFAVWFLNQVHFKCQRVVHHCASAEAVPDIPFHHFNFEEELRCIGMNCVHAKAPNWFQKLQLDDKTKAGSGTNKRSSTSSNNNPINNNERGAQRRTINNNEKDLQSCLKENEKYSFVCHRLNIRKCKEGEVTLNGGQICNNWHIRGWCHDQCPRVASHTPLTGNKLEQFRAYVQKLRQATEEFRRNYEKHRNRQRAPSQYHPNTTPQGENN